jgi:hypothetical protein
MPVMLVFWLTAIAVATSTWVLGWWGVVTAALAVGALCWKRTGIAWMTALAAIVAWSVLLLIDATRGRFAALASAIGGTMGIPSALLLVVTLLFASLLAWSSAVVGSAIASAVTSRREKAKAVVTR